MGSVFQSGNVVFFPFMAKGHTVPLLHLIHLLRRRFPHLSVTLFTTAANRPFISQFLLDSDTDSISIINLSFPQNVPGLPAGVESTDTLPSITLFPDLWAATELMQPEFEKQLQALSDPVTFLISDMFLWWTVESASKFGIPRINFSGMSNFNHAIVSSIYQNALFDGVKSSDELITVTDFPWVKFVLDDLDEVFWHADRRTCLHFQLITKSVHAATNSYGLIVNSFYELEPTFCDYSSDGGMGMTWNIGPLCLAQTSTQKLQTHQPNKTGTWLEWLEAKLRRGEPVLYVAFGSQAEISSEQMKEIEIGLEESEVSFLWARKDEEIGDGFEERVKERGIVVREWVDQWEVLNHESVKGFLSHCGWNSVVESLSCGVPVLAFPLVADQALNARMVVEELRAGMRTVECGGLVKGFVKGKGLQRLVRELMEGEKGKEVRKRAMEISAMAKKAMAENGSSWRDLEQLVHKMCSNQLPFPHTVLAAPSGDGINNVH
ncbi:UDP-glycosyltransferase 90A1-like [Cucurbita maxima]|uniref:Glycosyltransferase n=1 Tax=Cucurbita maxima TaxID=3661 RepID=A0A6J1JYY7_CUCMA|nr:UDP-glycosyltransferase 90A1-like [Cucurbita maxima]